MSTDNPHAMTAPLLAEITDWAPQKIDDLPFYMELAREAGGPVLELACGTGRVLLAIARAGMPITGLEVSPARLDRCRDKLRAESAAVQGRVALVEGDMTAFALGQTFALVIAPWHAFSYLATVADQLACLHCIHRHVRGDGRFVLDLRNPGLGDLATAGEGEEHTVEPSFPLPTGRHVEIRGRDREHDLAQQIEHVERSYHVTHPDGRHEHLTQQFPYRYLFRYEAEHLLVRCGFAVEHLYAGYRYEEFGSVYPGELLFFCRKAPR